MCLHLNIFSQDVRDSIVYYIDNESVIGKEIFGDRILEFTESLFSQLNIEEIGIFYEKIDLKIDSVDDILARTYLKEVNCAFLSNSSRYDEAETCCKSIVDIGISNGRTDIEEFGLHDLSYVYNHQGKYEEQIALLSRVIAIWKERDNSSEYLRYATQQKAEGFSYLAMFDSSLYYMEEAELLEREFGDSLTLCNVYEKYSRIYLEKGEYLKSFEFGQKGLQIARALDSKIRIQTNLMYVGFSAFYLGRYNQAIEHELEALGLYEGERNSSTASVYIRLGRIYNSIEDYEQALRYLKVAESILQEVDYDVGLAKASTEMAFTYIRMNKLDVAFNHLQFATKVFQDIGDDIYLSLAQRRMALLYDAQELCDLGIDVQNQAIIILEKGNKKGSLATAYLEKANILSNCNRNIDALNMALQGLELQKETGDIKSISEAHFFLYNLFKEQNNLSSALFHFEQYTDFYKKLTQSTEQQAIAEERARFKVEQIEKTNEVVTARNEVLRERNILYLVAAGILLLLGIVGMFYFRKLKNLNSEIEQSNSKIENQNTQLKNLNITKDKFFGIIAHDLRNPLVAFQGLGEQIRYYTRNKNLEKLNTLSGQVESLSSNVNALLDNLLNWSLIQTGQIPYAPKKLNVLQEVEEVCEIIIPLSNSKSIDLEVEIGSKVSVWADPRSLQTILRNLLTNSLKYTETNGLIEITTFDCESTVIIVIKDTGIGMSKKQIEELQLIDKASRKGTQGEKGTGLGLILCQELVGINKGIIEIESQIGKGTEVSITLPKNA